MHLFTWSMLLFLLISFNDRFRFLIFFFLIQWPCQNIIFSRRF